MGGQGERLRQAIADVQRQVTRTHARRGAPPAAADVDLAVS